MADETSRGAYLVRGAMLCCRGKAVTMDSYLICACGGIIKPKTSGQEYED